MSGTGRCGWGAVVAWAVALLGGGVPASHAQSPPRPSAEILIERTVAIVGGAVITQSEVMVATALGLVPPEGTATPGAGVRALVDRWLMLHEVERFSPPDPDSVKVDAGVDAARARAGGEAALAAVLARGGFTTGKLAAWIRDDLRIAAYLAQRFVTTGAPTDTEVAAYVSARRVEFERSGVAAADEARVARERMADERRRGLIADWLADLRRRTTVVEFPPYPGP